MQFMHGSHVNFSIKQLRKNVLNTIKKNTLNRREFAIDVVAVAAAHVDK